MNAFAAFLDIAFEKMMLAVPELPAEMGIFSANDTTCPQNTFSPLGEGGDTDRLKLLKDLNGELSEFCFSELSVGQQVSAEVLTFFLNYANEHAWLGLKGADFTNHRYFLQPATGIHNKLPMFLNNTHPFRDQLDAQAYLGRVQQLKPQMEAATELHQQQIQRGITLPGFLLTETLEEIHNFYQIPVKENSICCTFTEKAKGLLNSQDLQQLCEEIETELLDHVYPAYKKSEETLKTNSLDPNRHAGLWQLPDGEDHYAFMLRAATTTDHTADEIHDIGIEQTALLSEQIRAQFRKLDMSITDIGKGFKALAKQSAGPMDDTKENRKIIVREIEEIISNVKRHLPDWFDAVPQADVVVRPFPSFAEATATQSFLPASEDGTRPGILEINLAHLLSDELPDLNTLIYHESWPGHHLQFAYAQELANLPQLRKCLTFDAYIEGWAKYAETLPLEHGLTDTPVQWLLALRRELFSTVNLVVDTGIHHKRWTHDQAVSYFSEKTGMPEEFSRYIVHRSAATPAQLCSYKMGLMKMREFKSRLMNAGGNSFNLKDFHRVILANGAVPIEVLEKIVLTTVTNLAAI